MKCPNCKTQEFMVNKDIAEMMSGECPTCGYPIKVPRDKYWIVEWDDGTECVTGESCLELI